MIVHSCDEWWQSNHDGYLKLGKFSTITLTSSIEKQLTHLRQADTPHGPLKRPLSSY